MANTYTLINSVTATSGTSVSFTSIPQTYTDLVILVSAKSTYTSGGGSLSFSISFNSNGSNYNSRSLQMYASSSIANNTDTTQTFGGITGGFIRSMGTSSFSATTSTYSNCKIYIPSYTSSNNKSFWAEATAEDNAGSGTSANSIVMHAGQWANSAAITSIEFGLELGTFVSPSTFYLYGIKNS
jgi:hypothetical protein